MLSSKTTRERLLVLSTFTYLPTEQSDSGIVPRNRHEGENYETITITGTSFLSLEH